MAEGMADALGRVMVQLGFSQQPVVGDRLSFVRTLMSSPRGARVDVVIDVTGTEIAVACDDIEPLVFQILVEYNRAKKLLSPTED